MFISNKQKKELNHKYDYLLEKFAKQQIEISEIKKELLIQKSKILKLKNQKPKEEKDFEKIFENNKKGEKTWKNN